MARTLTILGATGSIGSSALAVVDHCNRTEDCEHFEIEALTAHKDVHSLADRAIKYGAKRAVIADAALYADLKEALDGSGIEPMAGSDALEEVARIPVDRVLAAIVGIAGLKSSHAALDAGNSVALANKESMVCAGSLLKTVAAARGAAIIPTDSEHNAMFQVMERGGDVERLILTASGGPFRETPAEKLKRVTPKEACAHPNWSMGRKISVDSATLMNKALELIEASYLFDFPEDRIDVLVHPQSVIHSLVAYRDGSTLAQLGTPDMRTPIAHALSWPERRLSTDVKRLDLAEWASLTFGKVDDTRFPSIRLARHALNMGPAAPVVLNAANEVAVSAFLEGKCRFLDIRWIVEEALGLDIAQSLKTGSDLGLGDVMSLDQESRRRSDELVAAAGAQMRSEAQ
ncbi:MAG: 1-deoxy-D-xylulose-5-phosphate reductoisomerase [Henriciella sp.]|uniref:1-deoxy-D-xylulose-5-phosphate reductoisomerase n=1 Tax=Henriciella sp. TaxID=1968823 RepID=UPI003C78CDFC